jgi:hypothetical protein
MTDRRRARATEPPSWLRGLAFVPAAAALSFGVVGLALAINGWYRPLVVLPPAALMLVGLVALARPALRDGTPADDTPNDAPNDASSTRAPARRSQLQAVVGVAAIVAITAWNTVHASTHVLVDRDGGAYATSARWIARAGSLSVHPRVGPFKAEHTLSYLSLAIYQMRDGSLQFQFAHLLPVLLAEAHAIGGDAALFDAPELLGGAALLAFFVLAWRLVGHGGFALAAVLALAFTMPEVSFSRDSYSEIPSQLFLFTALWLLTSRRGLPHWRVALVAGSFLGALEALRADAIVLWIGVPVVCAYMWLHNESRERRRATAASIAALAIGVVPGALVGLTDLVRHSGGYYSSLRSNLIGLSAATIASAVAGVIAVLAAPFVRRVLRPAAWRIVANATAVLVAAVGFAAWALRPHLQHVAGNGVAIVGLQRAEHTTVNAGHLYYERSLTWMSWYLGPLTLAAAIIGAALLVRALLRGRYSHAAVAVGVMVPGALLYLYKADAVPDHIWVTRRFLLNAVPTLVLLAAGLACWLWSNVRRVRAGRIAAAVLTVVAVGYPVTTIAGVQAMGEQRGYLEAVHAVCRDLGPHAAAVVIAVDSLELTIPQTLRSFCGADVASSVHPTGAELRGLARAWGARGRRFYVVARSAADVRALVPEAQVASQHHASDTQRLRPTLTRRPSTYGTESLSVVVARIPPTG